MDEQNNQTSRSGSCGSPTGESEVQRPAGSRVGSTIAYYGDAARVREGGGKAAVTGDFVLTADEVNPVIKTLRSNGIEVTALHSHMLDEQPRLFFCHFWANDDAVKLAKGLRAALDKAAVALN